MKNGRASNTKVPLKKTPRFFCDNCGVEVGRDEKACPHCGRFFASVRCPACGFAGEERLFASGCPSCGYSAGSSAPGLPPRRAKPLRGEQSPAGPLPRWVYAFSIVALLCVLGILLFVIMR